MRLIFLKNKENFDIDVVHRWSKFFDVIQKNQPWFFKLRRKFPLAASKSLPDAPHRVALFSSRGRNFRQQQNINIFLNRA